MGLTIHFRLIPRTELSAEAARRLVIEARRRTARLIARRGFGEVTPVMEADAEATWLTQFVTREVDGTERGFDVVPDVGWFFSVHPGPDCESVILGLCRYPKTIRVEGRRLKVGAPGWGLRGSCKTQYASLHGWAEFLRCHQLVIDVLRVWARLGALVEIIDEGEYWPGRDVTALGGNLAQMNRAVAGLAGALKDAVEEDGGGVASPIFAHPQFEYLEAEGASEMAAKLVEAARVARNLPDAPL